MSTGILTDRYVHEVVRRVPADQRQDIAEELRGTITDTIDGRHPGDAEQAEQQVLTELGDPIQLAARYSDRPQALIGPRLYPTYIRLLVTMLAGVLPVVLVVMVLLDVLEAAGIGQILTTALWVVIGVGGQIIAWSTVVFALVERAQHRSGSTGSPAPWSVANLPEPAPGNKAGPWAWASAAGNAMIFAVILWQQFARPFRTEGGEQIAVLDPALWSGWIWPILIGLLAAVVAQFLRIAARGWTRLLVGVYLVVEVLQVVPLAWILHQQMLFNPAFLAEVSQDWTTPDEVYTGAAVIVVLIAVSGVVTRFRQVYPGAS